MTQARLKELKTRDDVARACGVESSFIEAYAASQNQKDFYDALKLPKRGKRRKGEFRVVFAAREQRLRAFHRSMSMIVTNSVTFDTHVQGFVKRRSTRTNAEQHLAAKVLLHADIQGFFDTITTEQVTDAFIKAGARVPIASYLAKACTIDGLLRQGTRCSPALANAVCLDMDQAFLHLSRSISCVYTRYADDLTFSGEELPSDEAVQAILATYGFTLRDNRCYRQHRGRTQFVTGLSVADHAQPRLPRKLKRRLRLTMHYIEKHGLEEHFRRAGVRDHARAQAWLRGMLMYAHSIEPAVVAEWQNIFDRAVSNRPPDDRPNEFERDGEEH